MPTRSTPLPKIRSYLIAEGFKPGATSDGLRLNMLKISRRPRGIAAADQPKAWTLIEFEPEEEPNHLATGLSKVLDAPGWYTVFGWKDQKFVIFPNRVFRFLRGDQTHHEEVAAYARSVGVPVQQADWEDSSPR